MLDFDVRVGWGCVCQGQGLAHSKAWGQGWSNDGRVCYREQAGRPKCPMDPYFIIPDKCKCVDFQTLKLQETPDAVPHGEMPRHMQLYCDRYGVREGEGRLSQTCLPTE